MTLNEDEDKPLFVRDMADGQVRTGLADLRHSALSVTLYAFDGHIHIDESKEAVFTTEKGEIVSLHNFFATGGGYRQGTGATVWNDTLQANQVVIGPDEWKEGDVLKRCTFKVDGASDLLHNMERFDAIEKAEFGDMPSLDVFTADVVGAKVTLSHDVRGGGFNRRATYIEPKFVIEFDDPRTIQEARKIVNNVVAFLSLAQVRKLSVDQFSVSRMNLVEIEAAIKAEQSLSYNYEVRFYSPDTPDVGKQPWTGRSFTHVRGPEDVSLFVACLKQWLDRDLEWRPPTALMTTNFSLSREISGDRLLSATRWIERIPGNAGPLAMSKDHIEEVVSAAVTKASALGYGALEKRIRGSLKAISEESNQQRLQRLVERVESIITEQVWKRGLVYGAMKARDFRGQAAHGRVQLKNKRENDDFELAIVASECLAYLLMLADFPLDDDARRRVHSSNPVSHFVSYWQHYFQEWAVDPV